MNDIPFVSIIIPVREINDYIRESIPYILNLDYKNFEVLIFPDGDSHEVFDKTRIIPTGKMGPAEKRDMALKYAKGEIFAFLDDDAYPERDWLDHVVNNFNEPDVAAVGGPAVTPEDDSIAQKASGLVFESLMGGGNNRYRYIPCKDKFDVDDFPTVNFSICRDVFEELAGFDTVYWPGEDTKLCLDIVHGLGKRIVYEPKAVVYHHRRKVFRQHLKQISSYALHRGYFVKKYPETSLRIGYFIPSMFLVYLVTSLFLFFWYPIILAPMGLYVILLGLTMGNTVYRYGNLGLGLLTGMSIFLTHVFYGFYFLKGIAARRLER
ncbi:glycosyltransferase [bacterium]|nr:glycosyltransferase [bacterium]MBI9073644.1 glycosyltransferase [Melioribacteraceae bacterium]